MAAQRGKDILLKISDGEESPEYVTVAGLRARTISLNARAIDVTDGDSAGRWRELLAGAGAKHAKVSGAGIFKDAASDALIRQYVFDGTIRAWQVIIPDFGTVQGPFQIAAFELTGRHDGEVAFELSPESRGRAELHRDVTPKAIRTSAAAMSIQPG